MAGALIRGTLGYGIQGAKWAGGKILGLGPSKSAQESIKALQANGMSGEQATAIVGHVGKGGFLGKMVGGALKGTGALAAGDLILNGKEGLTGGLISKLWIDAGKLEAEQNKIGGLHGFLVLIKEMLDLVNIESDYLNNKIAELGDKQNKTNKFIERITENGEAGTLKTGVNVIGVPISALAEELGLPKPDDTAAAALGLTTVAAGVAAKTGYSAYKNRGANVSSNTTVSTGGPSSTPPSGGSGGTKSNATLPDGKTAPAGNPVQNLARQAAAAGGGQTATKTSLMSKAAGALKGGLKGVARRLPIVGGLLAVGTTAAMAQSVEDTKDVLKEATSSETAFSQSASSETIKTVENTIDAQETKLGGEALAAGGATVAAFALASNPVGWGVIGVTVASVAVATGVKYLADNKTNAEGKTYSEAAGETLSNAWDTASDSFDAVKGKLSSLFKSASSDGPDTPEEPTAQYAFVPR